jgi:hypothetical protein
MSLEIAPHRIPTQSATAPISAWSVPITCQAPRERTPQRKGNSTNVQTSTLPVRFGGLSRSMPRRQMRKRALFAEALKIGKTEADDRVERSLYQRAVGCTYSAVKIFMPAGANKPVIVPYEEHVPPDVTAGIFGQRTDDQINGVTPGISRPR